MYLEEKKLKENFWKYYNGNNRAIRYQFECDLRHGAIDLVTIEKYQDNFQVNAFEFKLTDIKKAICQAENNSLLVNRSWIVVPEDRRNVITNKYLGVCKEKGIGIIYVEDGGRWSIGLTPKFKKDIPFTQKLLNLIMNGF